MKERSRGEEAQENERREGERIENKKKKETSTQR